MNSFARSPELLSLKRSLPKSEPVQVVYKDVEVGTTYSTVRNGVMKTVYVAKVKKDQVILKRDQNAVDSFTETRARFDEYYQKV